MHLKNYKKRQLIKQYIYRKRYYKIYNLYFILKCLLKNNFIENQYKVLSIFLLIQLNRNNFISYHKNICLISGHKRSVFNFFKMNRMTISTELNNLYLPGIKKAIW